MTEPGKCVYCNIELSVNTYGHADLPVDWKFCSMDCAEAQVEQDAHVREDDDDGDDGCDCAAQAEPRTLFTPDDSCAHCGRGQKTCLSAEVLDLLADLGAASEATSRQMQISDCVSLVDKAAYLRKKYGHEVDLPGAGDDPNYAAVCEVMDNAVRLLAGRGAE